MKLEISAIGENESFARSAVAGFCLALNPTLTELSDIKTAVSEAVTNSIVHGYHKHGENQTITIVCTIEKTEESIGELHIEIADNGCGIADVELAQTPFYTTLGGDERSGMGFTIMQAFMHEFSVESELGKGTRVKMIKKIGVIEE
jgi:stage II sporulation protein AB (anti-sigma F factor)